MLKAKKSQLLPVVASEKTLLATAEAPPFVAVASVASVASGKNISEIKSRIMRDNEG